jgi:hypothetical protein
LAGKVVEINIVIIVFGHRVLLGSVIPLALLAVWVVVLLLIFLL